AGGSRTGLDVQDILPRGERVVSVNDDDVRGADRHFELDARRLVDAVVVVARQFGKGGALRVNVQRRVIVATGGVEAVAARHWRRPGKHHVLAARARPAAGK